MVCKLLPLGSMGLCRECCSLGDHSPVPGPVPGAESPGRALTCPQTRAGITLLYRSGRPGSFAVSLERVLVSSASLGKRQEVGIRGVLDIGPCPRGKRGEEAQEGEKR